MPDGTIGGSRPEPELKALDAWWTVLLIDPVAVRLVRALRPFGAVTPMRLTLLAHLLGLVSAAMFAAGWLLASAIVFEVRFVIDCADGKLARARGSASSAGAYVDHVGDNLVIAINLAALALHLSWEADLPVVVAVGLPVAFLMHVTAHQARLSEAIASGSDGSPRERKLPGGYREWMAARRLRAWPSRIDAEHVLLFVAPLASLITGEDTVLVVAAWTATVYFGYRAARMTVGGYRIAAGRDAVARRPS